MPYTFGCSQPSGGISLRPFPLDDSSLCQADTKVASTHAHMWERILTDLHTKEGDLRGNGISVTKLLQAVCPGLDTLKHLKAKQPDKEGEERKRHIGCLCVIQIGMLRV